MTANTEDADADAPPPAATTQKKKKRKKRAASGAPASARRKRDDFASEWPAHPDLDVLLAAFDAGNYALVRERGHAALARTKTDALPPSVQAAVRELLRRIEPDRTAVIMLGIAVLLMAFLAWFYWTHPRAG